MDRKEEMCLLPCDSKEGPSESAASTGVREEKLAAMPWGRAVLSMGLMRLVPIRKQMETPASGM